MTDNKQEALHRVLAAVTELGEAGTRDIADRAGMAYSTVTPKLRALQSDGLAEWFTDETGKRLWRPIDGVSEVDDASAATAAQDAKHGDESDQAADGDAGQGGVETGSGEEAAVVTYSGQPSMAGGEPETGEEPGIDEDVTPGEAEQSAEDQAPKTRRRSGGLRNAVLKILQDAPEQRFKVSDVCKAIDAANTSDTATASAGAVRNALDKLTAQGSVTLVVERPATFQAV